MPRPCRPPGRRRTRRTTRRLRFRLDLVLHFHRLERREASSRAKRNARHSPGPRRRGPGSARGSPPPRSRRALPASSRSGSAEPDRQAASPDTSPRGRGRREPRSWRPDGRMTLVGRREAGELPADLGGGSLTPRPGRRRGFTRICESAHLPAKTAASPHRRTPTADRHCRSKSFRARRPPPRRVGRCPKRKEEPNRPSVRAIAAKTASSLGPGPLRERVRSVASDRATACGSGPSAKVRVRDRAARKSGSVVSTPAISYSSSARASLDDRLRPVAAGHHELSEHGVVVDRHRRAGLDSDVVSHAGSLRETQALDDSGRGGKSASRVLRVDPALDRVTAGRISSRVERERRSERGADHLAHQVHTRDFLGDRMLHLQPRVHLEEVERSVLGEEELDRAARVVTHGVRRRESRGETPRPHFVFRPRGKGTPRPPSGGAAGCCTPARRPRSGGRGGPPRSGPPRGAPGRAASPRRSSRHRKTPPLPTTPVRRRRPRRPRFRPAAFPCRRRRPKP